jgi:hypothetical protein
MKQLYEEIYLKIYEESKKYKRELEISQKILK